MLKGRMMKFKIGLLLFLLSMNVGVKNSDSSLSDLEIDGDKDLLAGALAGLVKLRLDDHAHYVSAIDFENDRKMKEDSYSSCFQIYQSEKQNEHAPVRKNKSSVEKFKASRKLADEKYKKSPKGKATRQAYYQKTALLKKNSVMMLIISNMTYGSNDFILNEENFRLCEPIL